ncbi:MAG: hypothetical protein ACRD1J_10075, partial [Terriglobia bacterium]
PLTKARGMPAWRALWREGRFVRQTDPGNPQAEEQDVANDSGTAGRMKPGLIELSPAANRIQ